MIQTPSQQENRYGNKGNWAQQKRGRTVVQEVQSSEGFGEADLDTAPLCIGECSTRNPNERWYCD